MSLVVPFRAVRPAKPFAAQVAAPPYDVLSAEEARRLIQANPLSFLRVEKSESDFPEAADPDDPRIYERAKENLEALIGKGILRQEEREAFFLYRQCKDGHVQTGIVACVSLAEYEAGKIKRHELTRADKERERTDHIDTAGAQTGPIFLAYRGREEIDSLTARIAQTDPEYDFTAADGVAHTVWSIGDPGDMRGVMEEFTEVEALYIADGHHRAAAAAAVARRRKARNKDDRGDERHHFLLAVIFPAEQLRIMDYNRAVRDLNGLSREAFLERVGNTFLIRQGFSDKNPRWPREFGMYLDGAWFLLTAREAILRDDDPIAGLDVSLLQEYLLGPVLGIRDPRTDARIDFIGGIRGMEELERLVDRKGFAVAFSLYPPTLGQMMAVADAGKVMPPKSTWFEPKLRSGLFVHLLE